MSTSVTTRDMVYCSLFMDFDSGNCSFYIADLWDICNRRNFRRKKRQRIGSYLFITGSSRNSGFRRI